MPLLRTVLSLMLLSPLMAQVDRATITGTFHDPSGAVVTGVAVVVRYPATGLRRAVASNEAGLFLVSGLPVGAVEVTAEKPGFRPISVTASMGIGETKTLDLRLEIATAEVSVQVVAANELVRNSAATGATFENSQIERLPVNGRNWSNLMALVPGAVDTGAGNGNSVRFMGRGGDDNNFRIDGVDATSIRNQGQAKSRLLISMDAISEFRVSSALYSAESGGAPGGQIEIASKSGTNQWHGSLFEYLRNSALDARSPFDGATLPPFRLNQFGGSLGGALVRDRTFFFGSYEGLIQRRGITQIGFVPTAAFRASATAAVQPILRIYPEGQTPVNANVAQWRGVGSSSQDEHIGLFRADHRFNDRFSGYFRFSKNHTDIFAPNAALPVGTANFDAPTSGLFDLLHVISPRTTNEIRLGANYSEPLNSATTATGINIAVAVPSLSTIPADTKRIAIGISQSLIDNWSSLRGAHTLKAGVEIRRIQLIIHDFANAQAGTLTFASLADFAANRLNTAEYSGELPTKQMRKIASFGYVQDEWKLRSNLTANLGLRYEFYNVFREIHDRAIPFDVQSCGGYCPPGSAFSFPDTNNFAPRVSLAWAPKFLKDRTVIRAGGGYYYGDAQLGDAYSPANNDAVRASLSIATTPGLSFPIERFLAPGVAIATAPRSMPRNKRNQISQQWGFSVQQAIAPGISLQSGYSGQQNYHTFNRQFTNVIDPATGRRPFPTLDQIDVRGADGVSSFHALVNTMQISRWKGLLLRANYMWSHAINDGSAGGGGADGPPQNVACRSCEKGHSSIDARHVFSANFAYQLPLGRRRWYGGWEWSGISTARSGLPLNVTVTRRAQDLPDGNTLSAQRPNLVPGVPLYLDYGTTNRWINLAAFAVPPPGQWGNLGRNSLRAPGLFQVDTALTKRTALRESLSADFGVQFFNLLNHPQLGIPAANISATSNFGRITAPINTSPVGAGTPRQIQFYLRVAF